MYGDCVFDNPNDRVLNGHFFTSSEMTVEMCLKTCRQKKYRYSGLQWQIECYCGNEPTNGFDWAWLNKCDTKCAGDSNQICGGSGAMSVFSTEGVHGAGSQKQACNSIRSIYHFTEISFRCQYRFFSIGFVFK